MIIYDQDGDIVIEMKGEPKIDKLHCCRKELNTEEAERKKTVESIAKRVRAGERLREVIGELNLSSEEKWHLEAEVKEYGNL